ncbi:E3 ubiquitin-protein ligase HOS1 [Acetobacter orientalis]|uniref:E3 ubiquitin-protein ligase HOS1 n=1 Tax=Acetobacter orientalis TaxID=146474 RepID=A0A2Z5ZLY3_9PROT|nr:E3 ubiquitin-protein ligase HOS1 [Acetobacter orientalis]
MAKYPQRFYGRRVLFVLYGFFVLVPFLVFFYKSYTQAP